MTLERKFQIFQKPGDKKLDWADFSEKTPFYEEIKAATEEFGQLSEPEQLIKPDAIGWSAEVLKNDVYYGISLSVAPEGRGATGLDWTIHAEATPNLPLSRLQESLLFISWVGSILLALTPLLGIWYWLGDYNIGLVSTSNSDTGLRMLKSLLLGIVPATGLFIFFNAYVDFKLKNSRLFKTPEAILDKNEFKAFCQLVNSAVN